MTSQHHNLPLRYVADPAATAAGDDPYWLTIAQIVADDRATPADVAEVVDELYDLEACIDVETAGTAEEPAAAEPPSRDKLLDIAAAKFDLAACKRRKTGTYTAELKIARSHQNEPYKLTLSVGEILETVKVEAQVSVTVPVTKAASLVLPQPVASGLAASWLGPVYSPNGTVPQPEISARHNTLSWGAVLSGTIRADYLTVYDLVTVEIPGIPKYVGSPLGDPQDSQALAFYHYLAYPADITPPPEDNSADAATLAEVCGWSGDTLDQPEEPEPLPEPPPPPEYGCVEWSLMLADPNYYADKCCHPEAPNGCRTRTEANPGGHELPQETIDQLTREHTGPIEFIAVGPDGVEGCGTIYWDQVVRPQNCCDEVEPMEWDTEISVEVLAPSTSGIVGVTGGAPPYHWSIRGSGFALSPDGRLRDGVSDSPHIYVYALSTACGWAPIEVTDGCSIISDGVRCTVGRWVELPYPVKLNVAGYYSGSSPGYGVVSYEGISGRHKTWFLYSPASFNYPIWTQQAVINLACAEPPMAYYSNNPYVLPPAGYVACGTESGMYYSPSTGPDFGTPLYTLRPGADAPIVGYLDGAKSWEWVC